MGFFADYLFDAFEVAGVVVFVVEVGVGAVVGGAVEVESFLHERRIIFYAGNYYIEADY